MAGFKGYGGGNMQAMLRQAQQMQQKLKEAQDELEELELEGTAGSGMVKVVVNGKKIISSVTIDPKAVDPDDVEMLEDLVMAAVNDAYSQADEEYERLMGPFQALGGML
ncbi:MAG: YbaB/EbfC family nucleoid-associated protein [Clostridiales bacterium]|nr:YbaB/EbfC family nucleoid-associated protein [Eubacteriales bacterium]MCI7094874.1 YbaB/EbfC family nucleoid-associated protein [Clostridiales bacterium]MDD6054602.1 YbaB/EbfC family nucleoid-associated protein [Clostridiales bacterium]MDD7506709.1 YbaB/EbfC family nucleoid-associated protein [Clostridiales bacterium]MDY5677639.1 YbaB/EbfC family nucleoid-associated protein [Eubacteriales bacterium]